MNKNEVAKTLGSNGAGRDLVHQLLGQAQMAGAFAHFSQTVSVSKLAVVKESKLYQQLAGTVAPNGLELKGTWAEFCGLLGMSDEKANQDIANLQTFGEEAMEQMQRVGIGYRDLKQFRRLPTDEKTALIEAAKAGDKDTLLELAESLISKNQKQQADAERAIEALNKKIAKAQADLNDQVEINQGLTKKKLKSDLRADTQLVRDECLHQQALVEYGALALLKAWEGVMAEDTGAPEHNLRRDQIVHAVRAAAAAAVKVARQIEQEAGGDVQVTMLHMLTPEEAKAWQADWDTIRSGLRASDAARFDRLQAELPRDVGRPKGSKTKGKAEA